MQEPATARASETMGDAIRRRRLGRGLTQTRLAALCGVDQTTIRDYELRGVTPAVPVALRMRRALRMTWADFEHVFGGLAP